MVCMTSHITKKRKNPLIKFLVVLLILFFLPLSAYAAQTTPKVNGVVWDLGDYRVEDWEWLMQQIDLNSQLREVNLFNTPIEVQRYEGLRAHYPEITFGCTIRLDKEHMFRTDATSFAIKHNNKSKEHPSSFFEPLKYAPNLMALDLSHNHIDDLSFLLALPKLRVLLLGDNNIIDLAPLAQLQNLEYLELFKNKITSVIPIMDLPNLLDLNVAFNYIDDLWPLARLSLVERIWLYNSNNYNSNDPVDPEIVAALREAIYLCEINSTSYSTLGGWREHPRYYVVYNMLHGAKKWLPWTAEGLVPRWQ